MADEENKNKSSFTILDPKKVTGKDIVAIWRAELEKAAAEERKKV